MVIPVFDMSTNTKVLFKNAFSFRLSEGIAVFSFALLLRYLINTKMESKQGNKMTN